jgi:FeS assembly SUF system regulator
MIRVTKLTDYGIALMTRLAELEEDQQTTAPDLSRDMGLPLPTVRKILKQLVGEKLLVSTRGITGGYSLARSPENISLMDMVTALEGPVAMTECATAGRGDCTVLNCRLTENWSLVNRLLQNTLESFNLAQMSGSLSEIHDLRMK